MHTVESAKTWAAENSDGLYESLNATTVIPAGLKASMRDIWFSGCWLNEMLQAAGLDADEIADIGFVHGQRCFGRDPWAAAVALVNEAESTGTTKDRPGVELADQINSEVFGDAS